MSEDVRDDQRVVGLEVADQRLAQRGQLRPQPTAGSARTSGSWVPDSSASSIFRPETPSTSLATHASLMPASSSTLCSRLASCWRSLISDLPIPGQVTKLADRLGRHEAGSEQPALEQLAEPLRIEGVGLTPGDYEKRSIAISSNIHPSGVN
jgi:hypothetical protein